MQPQLFRIILATAIVAISFAQGASTAVAQTGPTLNVDAGSNLHPISPYIYGESYGSGTNATFVANANLGMMRWGGDATTTFNWNVNANNAGADFFFEGYPAFMASNPGIYVDNFITSQKSSASTPLVTIPIIPYVNTGGATALCSYPVSVYGAQESTTTIGGQSCGNGHATGGAHIQDTNLAYNYTANSTTNAQNWITHMVSTHGSCASGGICNYQLDNEPGGWSNTFQDIYFAQPNYSVITALGEAYATAIKSVDSTAKVYGPSDYLLYGWVSNSPTTDPSCVYYLKQFQSYDATKGTRSLDYLDEHYVIGDNSSIANDFAQIRNYWDPTYSGGTQVFTGYSTQNAALGLSNNNELIPRMQIYINNFYPGTGFSISEFEPTLLAGTGGPNPQVGNQSMVDAMVLADALGVFGYYGLQAAVYFPATSAETINPTDAEAFAYMLYRNYDGGGHQFGNTSVKSVTSDPTNAEMSVYGALRTSDDALTVIVINKTSSAILTTLTINGFSAASSTDAYTYSSANTSAIVHSTTTAATLATGYSYPAYSATEFALSQVSGATPAPPTGLTATIE